MFVVLGSPTILNRLGIGSKSKNQHPYGSTPSFASSATLNELKGEIKYDTSSKRLSLHGSTKSFANSGEFFLDDSYHNLEKDHSSQESLISDTTSNGEFFYMLHYWHVISITDFEL